MAHIDDGMQRVFISQYLLSLMNSIVTALNSLSLRFFFFPMHSTNVLRGVSVSCVRDLSSHPLEPAPRLVPVVA